MAGSSPPARTGHQARRPPSAPRWFRTPPTRRRSPRSPTAAAAMPHRDDPRREHGFDGAAPPPRQAVAAARGPQHPPGARARPGPGPSTRRTRPPGGEGLCPIRGVGGDNGRKIGQADHGGDTGRRRGGHKAAGVSLGPPSGSGYRKRTTVTFGLATLQGGFAADPLARSGPAVANDRGIVLPDSGQTVWDSTTIFAHTQGAPPCHLPLPVHRSPLRFAYALVSLSLVPHTVLQGGPAWTGRLCSRHWA